MTFGLNSLAADKVISHSNNMKALKLAQEMKISTPQ